MSDIVFLAVLVGFFALAVLFVRGCERIIGPDLEAESTTITTGTAAEPDRAAA